MCVCVTLGALISRHSQTGRKRWDLLMLLESFLPSAPPAFARFAPWGEGVLPSAPSSRLTRSVQPCSVSFLRIPCEILPQEVQEHHRVDKSPLRGARKAQVPLAAPPAAGLCSAADFCSVAPCSARQVLPWLHPGHRGDVVSSCQHLPNVPSHDATRQECWWHLQVT